MNSEYDDISKLFSLSGRVVILTGAAGLLGAQYAKALCKSGANVVLADIDFSKCKKISKELEKKYSTETLPLKVDLAKKNSIKNMVSRTIKKFSKIDVLINNAIFHERMKEQAVPFEKFPLDSWQKVISINITGMFLCCQEVGNIMMKQRNGVIINISSIYGINGADQRIYGQSGINSSIAYAVTKSAVLNFTRYLASYWNNTGIRVNTLSLGGVSNNQDPNFIKNYSYKTMLGRMAKKNEYAGAIVFLASDASSYMTGSNLIVDGGWTAW